MDFEHLLQSRTSGLGNGRSTPDPRFYWEMEQYEQDDQNSDIVLPDSECL